MVLQRESAAMLATQNLRFRCMAAQDLGFASIPHRGHSNATCMKGKRPMGRSDGMGVGKHIGKFRPTRRYLRSKAAPVGEQLFPGIPNEITWDLIVPKLWWKALPVLSSVSPAWKEAIRTNRVYEEKVRANSTETLAIHVHVHTDSGRGVVALFSTSDNCCYALPPIPCLPRGILRSCKCIALGGKIYVLGGLECVGGERVLKGGRVVGDTTLIEGYVAREEVYVLDLAGGHWKWKQCANMLESRYAFGCGVIDDKIYVMGGTTEVSSKDGGRSFKTHLLRSEVYDTQKNAWSPIMPMRQSMLHLDATVIAAPVGKDLLLYDGVAGTLGLYDPANDDWTVQERFGEVNFESAVFGAEGNLFSFSRGGIDVYDVQQNSWINRHIHSFAALLRPDDFAEFCPVSVLAMKNELHFTVDWKIGPHWFTQSYYCKGFDSEIKEMVWQEKNCGSIVQFLIQL